MHKIDIGRTHGINWILDGPMPSAAPPKKPYSLTLQDINRNSSPSHASTATLLPQSSPSPDSQSDSLLISSCVPNPSFHLKIGECMEDDECLDGNLHLAKSPQDDSSDDEEGNYMGEYYYNYGELTKKRIRITVLEESQRKISKWESNFKKPKTPGENCNLVKIAQLENPEAVFSDCFSSFAADTEGSHLALDLVRNGVGSIGCQELNVVTAQKRPSWKPSDKA